MGRFLEKYKVQVIILFLYWCICFVMLFTSGDFLYAMLGWNVLLAVCPLFFIGKALVTIEQRKVAWSILWMILWLFFFPNAMYMITDFIHLSTEKFLWVIEAQRYSADAGVVYSNDIMVWMKLLVIGIGFFYSIVVGLESFYTFEQIIRKRYSTRMAYSGVFAVSLLTGIGVYIGRFLRFNSWDILFNPFQLLKQMVEINGFAIQFIIAFTLFVVGSYVIYRAVRKQSALII